jgi:two-component system LytT family response regulator
MSDRSAAHAPSSSAAAADNRRLRVLIVDDEPLARTQIRELLAPESDLQVIGECGNGAEALKVIARDEPDLVLLDIQMPEVDGFSVAKAIGTEGMPAVIFVTASDAHALRAFDVHAVDYVLKPIDRDRLLEAIGRARRRIGAAPDPESERQMRARLATMIADVTAAVTNATVSGQVTTRLAIKGDGRVRFVRTTEVDWIEAMDNYVRLHIGRETHIIRDTLTRLEQRLPAQSFLRIHRSTIVNIDRIREIQPWFGGEYVLILGDGTKLTTGRRYRAAVQELLDRAM